MSRSLLEETVEFAENPEPRCPCILLLDTSASMQGRPIDALNLGVRTFSERLRQDPLASRRVEVCMVAYDSTVRILQPFVTADRFAPPPLTTQGFTFMGTAIHCALDLLAERKEQYRQAGITYYRPWVLMLTDGGPQGEPVDIVEAAAWRLKDDERNKRVAFFAVGVQDADMHRLSEIVLRPPVHLKGLDFTEMFVWLSSSMQKLAMSGISEEIEAFPTGMMDAQYPLPPAGSRPGPLGV